MLCAVIKGPTYELAREQLKLAQKDCSLVELRLDFFKDISFEKVKSLRHDFPLQMIFTLRAVSQGGSYSKSEEERLEQIQELAELKPAYIDLEYSIDPAFIRSLKSKHPDIQIIVSFHDFEKMPPLSPLLNKLKKIEADLYKIAVMVHSSSEALSLLIFMRDHQPNLLVMGMGPYGEITRILSPIYGGRFVYASLEQDLATASGQLTIHQLTSTYHYENLTPTTKVYGLIGDPVSSSIGYLTHNAVMNELQLSSVYVNFPVPKEQLKEFLTVAKKGEISGLSITMPLKEEVIPFIDEVDPEAKMSGAVNTLLFNSHRIKGYNTDGKGALDAIEERLKIKGKKIIIIGGGGAVKAIAAEACNRDAKVMILNRNELKAIALAKQLQCSGGSLECMEIEWHRGYDILINATSNPLPIDPKYILPHSLIMDINTLPKMSSLLAHASKINCTLVYGYEMFINQAIGQFKIWFEDKIDEDKLKLRMRKKVESLLKSL